MMRIEIKDLPTPALLVDLDIMESNLQKMSSFFENSKCKLRPHFKNHKCVELARMQLDRGAIGISTATLHETETLVNAGIASILIANEIAGESNLKHLVELCAASKIILAVDDEKVVNDLSRIISNRKNNLSLVVDIDLGLKRCGIQPFEPALHLAKKILGKGLKFDGLMGYEGHLQRLDLNEENVLTRKMTLQKLIDTKKLLMSENIAVNMVSAGGTGTYAIAGSLEGISEVQAGNYLLMDTSYARFAPGFQPSLTLLTTVISFTPGERFILNTGIKEISAERGMPALRNIPGASLQGLHAEHGIVEIIDKNVDVEVGQSIELSVFYSDGTVNLHKKLYGVRQGVVEKVFEIAH